MTALLPVSEIERRLKLLIPEQVDPRGWARNKAAARTIFVMLYGEAVEGQDRWIRPTAVADMTDEQAAIGDVTARKRWLDESQSRKRPRLLDGRWYEENSRESVRDSLRALVELGIVLKRQVPTTSPLPRYAISSSSLSLMSPRRTNDEFSAELEAWRAKHLSKAALARLSLVRKGKGKSTARVLVTLPTGESRSLEPGPSAGLTRAVIEEFGPLFLDDPAVLLVSESANKVGYEDNALLRTVGLRLDPQRTLPDVILIDLATEPPLLVFVECVATDGPVDSRRRTELEQMALESGFESSALTYVTAFHDRAGEQFRRMAASLAWSSFVWFETEPDQIIHLRSGKAEHSLSLSDIINAGRGESG